MTFDELVKAADAVVVASATEANSQWEDGRIYTYTRMTVERGIAGQVATGEQIWLRTLGGSVGNIGQHVDGEASFPIGASSLLFLRKSKVAGHWDVTARAQGQYPVVAPAAAKPRQIVRSSLLGVLYPPKAALREAPALPPSAPAVSSPANAGVRPAAIPGAAPLPVPESTSTPAAASQGATPAAAEANSQNAPAKASQDTPERTRARAATLASLRIATNVLHERSLDDAAQEIAAAWRRAHAAAPTAPVSK